MCFINNYKYFIYWKWNIAGNKTYWNVLLEEMNQHRYASSKYTLPHHTTPSWVIFL